MSKVAKLVINKDDMVFFNYTSVERVVQGKRIRDIDEKTVDELVESFKQFGVLEPITVTQDGGVYTVLAGHHRWLAFLRLLEQSGDNKSDYCMPAIRVFINKDDEEALQLAENLHRNDLSKEERKVMACRYLELLANGQKPQGGQKPKNGQKPQGGRPEAWFGEWAETTGIPLKTAQRMWQQYADAVGLTITPSKANVEQQQAFAQWHLEQSEKAKQDEEAKKQQSEQQRKAKELKDATEAYERAKGIYQRACDVAKTAGVENIQFVT